MSTFKKPIYPSWDGLFSHPVTMLEQGLGKDYTCSNELMVQEIKREAAARNLTVDISTVDPFSKKEIVNGLIVIVTR